MLLLNVHQPKTLLTFIKENMWDPYDLTFRRPVLWRFKDKSPFLAFDPSMPFTNLHRASKNTLKGEKLGISNTLKTFLQNIFQTHKHSYTYINTQPVTERRKRKKIKIKASLRCVIVLAFFKMFRSHAFHLFGNKLKISVFAI